MSSYEVKRKDGHSIDSLIKRKTVFLTLIAIILVVPTLLLTGCTTGQVVAPFNPKPVRPAPYNPEPTWNDKSDTTLASIQSFKAQTGQTVAPSGTNTAGANGTSGGVTPGGAPGGAPIPGTGPAPAPAPSGRTPLSSDPIYGFVVDRVEGGVIPNATVLLLNRRGVQIDSFKTGADGAFSFTGLTPGLSYAVTAAAVGYINTPLSRYDFTYMGATVSAYLQLAYLAPTQTIEGGNYYIAGGRLGMAAKPSGQNPPTAFNFWVGSPPPDIADVMPTYFFFAGTQQTYNALLFDDKALADGFEGAAEFVFQLPPPGPNGYSVDAMWLRFPDSIVGAGGIWTKGGFGSVAYWDWTGRQTNAGNSDFVEVGAPGWRYDGSTQANGFVQPPWWAVDATYGLIHMAVVADQQPWVLTYAGMQYDYHKDKTTPTLAPYPGHAPAFVSTGWHATLSGVDVVVVKPQAQEDCYATITVTGTNSGTVVIPLDANTISQVNTKVAYAAGQKYTVQLSDVAGHVSQTYGPFPVNP